MLTTNVNKCKQKMNQINKLKLIIPCGNPAEVTPDDKLGTNKGQIIRGKREIIDKTRRVMGGFL